MISDYSKKFVETMKRIAYLLAYLFFNISFDNTSDNYNSWKSFFCYENHQESNVKSYGR